MPTTDTVTDVNNMRTQITSDCLGLDDGRLYADVLVTWYVKFRGPMVTAVVPP